MSIRRILIALVIVLGAILGLGYLIGSQLALQGNYRMLDSIQSVRNGMSQDEVKALMGDEPSVFEAEFAPQWITDQTGTKATGSFWSYFMGFPPRNLIIYFDENDKVVFTSWAPT